MPLGDQFVGGSTYNTYNPQPQMAPIQNNAINAQLQAPGSVGLSGASQAGGNWLTGNQVTTNLPNGTSTTTGSPGFFNKGGAASTILGGIQTLGSLWSSAQQNKLAKKSFALQEESYRTNLGNQTKSYNTALEGRIRSQYRTEGKSAEQADSYIEDNKL